MDGGYVESMVILRVRYVDIKRQPVYDVIDHGTKVGIQFGCVFVLL